MSTATQEIRNVDIDDRELTKKAAAWLRKQLGYSQMDCYRALFGSDGDLAKAAEHLASGGWMTGKLISWDWESLSAKSDELSTQTGLPETLCLDLLKKCNGNVELSLRKLFCKPALERFPTTFDESVG